MKTEIFIEKTEARHAIDGKDHFSIMYVGKPTVVERKIGITKSIKRLVQESFTDPEEAEQEFERLTSEGARQILEGNFTEGSEVTVNIDGDVITRKVRWSGQAKDLYVTKNGMKYFYCEFWNGKVEE